MRLAASLLLVAALLAACSPGKSDAPQPAAASNTVTTSTTNTVATSPAPAPAPAAVTANTTGPAASAGFDPGSAPLGRAPTEPWPYFGLVDGYQRLSMKTKPGDTGNEHTKDVAFDRYEFFDGTKLITVEGRLITLRADGKGASFFQAQKTYEKLIHDLGGVTVFEGKGDVMTDKKLKFADGRHRAQYRLQDDQMGVYMVRTPSSQIWVEVYRPWEQVGDNYWLTILETKPLEVKMTAIPADELKRQLDVAGQVALYINFDTDKATIKPDSTPVIAQVVKLLTDNPSLKLTVEGHTDNVGSAPHNQALSEGRANAVVGALMAQGIALDRLQPKGFGQSKPIADNGTEEGRGKNRRVELVKR